MEFGLQVENTPFTPITFQDAKNISFKQIVKFLKENPQQMRIAVFTPNPISDNDSAAVMKHFKVMPDGFPDSFDYLLFKYFVAQSLITNQSIKIAVVCLNNFLPSSYVIARWLIDEKGKKLSQAIQALKKSFPIGFIEIELNERLTRMYEYDGTPIYLKQDELPVTIEKNEIDFNSIIPMIDQHFSDKANALPKRKPPKPPPPPKPQTKIPLQAQKLNMNDYVNEQKEQTQLQKNSSNKDSNQIQSFNYDQSDLPNQHEDIQFLNPYSSSQLHNYHRHHHHRRQSSQKPQIPQEKNAPQQPYQYEYKDMYNQQKESPSSNFNSNGYNDYYQPPPETQNYPQHSPPPPDYVPHSDYYPYDIPKRQAYQNPPYDYQDDYYQNYDHYRHPPLRQYQHYPDYHYDYQNRNSYQYDTPPSSNSYNYNNPSNSSSYPYDDLQNRNSYQYEVPSNYDSYNYDHQRPIQNRPPPPHYDDYEYQIQHDDYPDNYHYQYRPPYSQNVPYQYDTMYHQQDYRPTPPEESRKYTGMYDHIDYSTPIGQYPQDANTIKESDMENTPPPPGSGRSLQSLNDDPATNEPSLNDESKSNDDIPIYSGSFLNSSEGADSEGNHDSKDSTDNQENSDPNVEKLKQLFSSSHSIDNISYTIFSRIPMSRIGDDTSYDEYSEVCNDIANYFSIKNANLQNIQSLPFTHEEQLTSESFATINRYPQKNMIFRPIPDGVRCFLVVRGSKRFLISNETCREVKVSLFAPNADNIIQPVAKSLFEGFLVRNKFDRNPYFLIIDCFNAIVDLSDFPYKSRLEEAQKMVEMQQSKLNNQDSLSLSIIDTYPISKFEEVVNKLQFNFEVLGFSFLSPDSKRQPSLNQFNNEENNNDFQTTDTLFSSKIFRWFRDGCPVVEININNTMKCMGLARRNSSDDLIEAVDFGFAKKSMLRFNKKIVDLEYSPNLSKWQIKCISSHYKTWYADDVKNIVCGKEVMPYLEVKERIKELAKLQS